jgi:hypothetical protein
MYKPVQADQVYLSILVLGHDSIVIKFYEGSDKLYKLLIYNRTFIIICWYKS